MNDKKLMKYVLSGYRQSRDIQIQCLSLGRAHMRYRGVLLCNEQFEWLDLDVGAVLVNKQHKRYHRIV